jgi:hypothetical protein
MTRTITLSPQTANVSQTRPSLRGPQFPSPDCVQVIPAHNTGCLFTTLLSDAFTGQRPRLHRHAAAKRQARTSGAGSEQLAAPTPQSVESELVFLE